MLTLILGLILFLGIHSVRIVAPGFRQSFIDGRGENAWKGLYSVVSLAGLALLIWGYGLVAGQTDYVFDSPAWARSLATILMPISLVLLVASNFPPGYIKALVRHPMLIGTILWALVHLLNNGDMASVLLFGAFLVWAVADLVSAAARPAGETPETKLWPDLASIGIGLALTWAFVSFAHEWLFGVAPI